MDTLNSAATPPVRPLLHPRNVAIAFFVFLIAIQLVPVWMFQTNPATVAEPAWDSPKTRLLAQRACFDCHSNATTWPLYSKIAPVSWFVTRHVIEGREKLNFSLWGVGGGGREPGEAAEHSVEQIQNGSMPPRSYLLLHPDAKLSAEEQQQLIDGLQRSLR